MDVKKRDPRYSTPESLAAADEWNTAREQMEGLAERIRNHGLSSISATELAAAETRLDSAVRDLSIPANLIRFNPADWPGRSADQEGSTGSVQPHSQWGAARVNWCIAHGIWSGFFDDLAAQQHNTAAKQEGKTHARTRRTSK